ncbi:MAG: hypothetical protein ABIH08_01335 [Candidatus Omnitrophota bacterium]
MAQISNEVLHKEIDLIQACISRMAHNSFLIKGWTISLVAVVLALGDKVANISLLSFILLIPIISFWYLDAFFLHTEKKYRKIYEWVIVERKKGNEEHLYDLNPHRKRGNINLDDVGTIRDVMFSITLKPFYLIPIAMVILVFFINVFPRAFEVLKPICCEYFCK